jgi:methyltransferase
MDATRLAFVALAVYGTMALEARRASRNERAQLARGGVEPHGDVYKAMRVVYPLAFVAMLGEGVARGGSPPAPLVAAGIAIFTSAKCLKWWAIRSLGPAWTFRVIVVPGARLVTRGPYRWLRHPNYVGVIGELAGVALMAGALVSGVAAVTVFGLLIVKRIAVEERALDATREAPRTSKTESAG